LRKSSRLSSRGGREGRYPGSEKPAESQKCPSLGGVGGETEVKAGTEGEVWGGQGLVIRISGVHNQHESARKQECWGPPAVGSWAKKNGGLKGLQGLPH